MRVNVDLEKGYVVLLLVLYCLLMLVVSLGCAGAKPAVAPESAIGYDITPGAAITKVTWYYGGSDAPGLWMDVTVKNTSDKEVGFLVSVRVDDQPEISAGAEAGKKIKAGQEQTYKLMTSLATVQPHKINFKVALP